MRADADFDTRNRARKRAPRTPFRARFRALFRALFRARARRKFRCTFRRKIGAQKCVKICAPERRFLRIGGPRKVALKRCAERRRTPWESGPLRTGRLRGSRHAKCRKSPLPYIFHNIHYATKIGRRFWRRRRNRGHHFGASKSALGSVLKRRVWGDVFSGSFWDAQNRRKTRAILDARKPPKTARKMRCARDAFSARKRRRIPARMRAISIAKNGADACAMTRAARRSARTRDVRLGVACTCM